MGSVSRGYGEIDGLGLGVGRIDGGGGRVAIGVGLGVVPPTVVGMTGFAWHGAQYDGWWQYAHAWAPVFLITAAWL
jgi:hypothetical protein